MAFEFAFAFAWHGMAWHALSGCLLGIVLALLDRNKESLLEQVHHTLLLLLLLVIIVIIVIIIIIII
jgi:hypothetical protein